VEVLFVLKKPQVILLGNVLSDDECDAIIAHCGTRYTRSTVTAEADGASVVHEGRTSEMAFIQRGEAEVAERIDRRLAALAHWSPECSEPFQLQKYGPTQEYRPHYDWLDPDSAGHRAHLARGGQRLATFVLYLCDVAQGGGTVFPISGWRCSRRRAMRCGSSTPTATTSRTRRPCTAARRWSAAPRSSPTNGCGRSATGKMSPTFIRGEVCDSYVMAVPAKKNQA
jgi:hypothetical protein